MRVVRPIRPEYRGQSVFEPGAGLTVLHFPNERGEYAGSRSSRAGCCRRCDRQTLRPRNDALAFRRRELLVTASLHKCSWRMAPAVRLVLCAAVKLLPRRDREREEGQPYPCRASRRGRFCVCGGDSERRHPSCVYPIMARGATRCRHRT